MTLKYSVYLKDLIRSTHESCPSSHVPCMNRRSESLSRLRIPSLSSEVGDAKGEARSSPQARSVFAIQQQRSPIHYGHQHLADRKSNLCDELWSFQRVERNHP